MQKKLQSGLLLGPDGNLLEAGYATELVKDYNPENVRTSKMRLKEWDYYYIGNNDYGLALTIADNYYMVWGASLSLTLQTKIMSRRASSPSCPRGERICPGLPKSATCIFGKRICAWNF